MVNPSTLTMQSPGPVQSYRVQCVMGDAEVPLKDTVVPGPFAAGEPVVKDIFADGLAPVPPPFGPAVRFNVVAVAAYADSARTQTEACTFAAPAAPTVTLA